MILSKYFIFFIWALPPQAKLQKMNTFFTVLSCGGRALRGSAFAAVLAHSSLRRSPTIPNAVVLCLFYCCRKGFYRKKSVEKAPVVTEALR